MRIALASRGKRRAGGGEWQRGQLRGAGMRRPTQAESWLATRQHVTINHGLYFPSVAVTKASSVKGGQHAALGQQVGNKWRGMSGEFAAQACSTPEAMTAYWLEALTASEVAA